MKIEPRSRLALTTKKLRDKLTLGELKHAGREEDLLIELNDSLQTTINHIDRRIWPATFMFEV